MAARFSTAVRGILVLAVMCLATSALGSALAPGEALEATSATDGELLVRAGWLGGVLVWNPMNLETVEDWVACPLMYSSLFTYDEDWNMLEADLARSWDYTVMDNGTPSDPSDDYLIAHIEITENAYWRNADNPTDTTHPVTSNDVKFTFDMIIEENAGAWPLYTKGIAQFRIIDDYNLEIETSYPKATLFDDMAGIPIVPQYIWQDYVSPCTATMKPEDLVGCGPFVFDSMLLGSWVKFVTAPNYHRTTDFGEAADIDYDGIIFSTHDSAIELALAMNAGVEDCIVMTGEPNLYFHVLGDSSVHSVIKSAVQENGITDVAINAIPFENRTPTYADGFPLLVDPILREAILMCMDKDFINDEIMMGLSTQADSVIQPGYWHEDVTPEIPFDPVSARALLEANGYIDLDGDGYLECAVTNPEDWRSEYYGIELAGIRCQAPNTDPSYISIAMLWQSCAQMAGIGLVAEEKSEGVMVSSAWYKADYDIWVWHWGWGPEPLSTLSCWLTSEMRPGGDNCQMPMGPYEDYVNTGLGLDLTCYYDGSIYDQVWQIAGRTMDMEARQQLVYLLQQWVYDSRCEYPPCYDLGLYGYTEAQFTNWGDWGTHNGQNFMSGLPWLWFDLEPTSDTPPQVIVGLEDSYDLYVGDSNIFEVEVYDLMGDTLWANWSFGDGSPDVNLVNYGDTSVIPWVISISHIYETVANGSILSVTITDGVPGHTLVLTADVDVISHPDNMPPQDVDAGPDMTVQVGTTVSFNGYAYDPDDPLSSLEWEWVFREASGWGNVLEGQNVEFTFFNATIWQVTLTVTDPLGNSAEDSAIVTVLPDSQRSLQYQWHDMFNVPFGEWWDLREQFYGDVEIVSDEYPYVFRHYGREEGNTRLYTNMRLDISGSSMPEFNMNEDPVLLPFLGDTRGGNAEVDWYMQYMTIDEMSTFPDTTSSWLDGWVVRLTGTATLDEEAAMAVIGLPSAGFDDFDNWWAANGFAVEEGFADWMDYEGNDRLDIYNMYEYPFAPLRWELNAERVGDNIILDYDHISWGMEALMTRWLRDAFMPTEWYFEDMQLHATIGPDDADLNISTAVAYAAYAYTGLDGSACWVWEAMLQDFVESSLGHPVSDFDDYSDEEYMCRSPDSQLYGEYVPYDYTPGAFELGMGETMSFSWPDDYVKFYSAVGNGTVVETWDNMTVDHLEPGWLDLPGGSVFVDNNYSHEILFVGPIDMAAWSETQMTYEFLASEWDRLGLLPYGMPYIEFRAESQTIPNDAPVASFYVTPYIGSGNTTFFVDASSSWDPDSLNEPLLFRWDWEGDGVWDTAWSYGFIATHIYGQSGIYDITLAVRDTLGAEGYAVRTVLVDATAPVADAGPDQFVLAGDEVVLDGTASVDDFSIASFSWLFIDGGVLMTLDGPVVNYTFTDVGTYLIVLEVTDMVGNSDSDYMVLVVESVPEPVTVAKLSGGLDSVVSWTFVAGPNCTWSLEVENNGLSRLDVDVVDLTMDDALVLDETLRFTQNDFWYSGPIGLQEGHMYKVTLKPFGTAGSYAIVIEAFELFYGSTDYVYSSVEGTSVRVNGSSSVEPTDLAESVYDWLRVEIRFVW